MEPPKPLPWYPHKLAWQFNFSRSQVRERAGDGQPGGCRRGCGCKSFGSNSYSVQPLRAACCTSSQPLHVAVLLRPAVQLRKLPVLEALHEFIKRENELGAITRQEAVSMVGRKGTGLMAGMAWLAQPSPPLPSLVPLAQLSGGKPRADATRDGHAC